MTDLSGRCLCGAVTWAYSGETTRNLACHCRDCQRATASPFTAFVGLHPDGLRWSGKVNHYQSSPGARRGFCPDCGTRLYFQSTNWPGEIHLHAATLDDPAWYKPDAHVCLSSSPDWVAPADEVPKISGFHAAPETE